MLKLVTARNYFRVQGLLPSGSQLARGSTYITAGQTPMKTPTNNNSVVVFSFWFIPRLLPEKQEDNSFLEFLHF
jgi:hypothetical protein